MTKYRIYGVEGPSFVITVEAENIEEAKEKAEVVYDNHFKTGAEEKQDEEMDEKCWENWDDQTHEFVEIADAEISNY